ncbi:MAG: polysaccharide biosynthesis tyrosine autokinase [Methylomonas sp.]|jgi:tyrosine-protein kinase Etk/Wzc
MHNKYGKNGQRFEDERIDGNYSESSEILSVLINNKILISITTFVFFVFGVANALIETPIYKVDALLQVEPHTSTLTSMESSSSVEKFEIPVTAEIELLNSRTVIWKVIKNLNMDIILKPKYFSVFGETIARNYAKTHQANSVAGPIIGLSQYAWGGEFIQIENLDLPLQLMNKELTLIAGKPGFYQLINNGDIILEGEVGKVETKELENLGSLSIFISALRANEHTKFSISKQSEDVAYEDFKKKFHAAEKGRLTRIIELDYESSNPEFAVRVLNEIVNIHVQRSAEQKSAEAESTLEFLETQLPSLKQQVDLASTALNDFRSKVGSIDLDIETQHLLEGTVRIGTELTVLQQKRDDLRQKFTESHPSIIAIDKQIARLTAEIRSHENKIEVLPEKQKEILKLSRDVEVNSELYTNLLNKAEILRIEKAGKIGDIRVIDYAAWPSAPVKPKKAMLVIIYLVVGLIVGIAAAFVRKSLRQGPDSPEELEYILKVPVYGTIPHSREQEQFKEFYLNNNADIPPFILAAQNKDDAAIESLRGLRAALQMPLTEARNKVMMLTSPCLGVGKAFVTINLAVVLASAGKRILLIDADIRKGPISHILGFTETKGLSDVLANGETDATVLWSLAVNHIPTLNLDFVAAGGKRPNPSELLLNERFDLFLEYCGAKYDLIIIGSPPVLAVTDAAIIGRKAGLTLMVVKSGEHPVNDLQKCLKLLNMSGVKVHGLVLNDLPVSLSQHSYSKYATQYRSKSFP